MLQQALASRRVAIDRGRLVPPDSGLPTVERTLAAAPAAGPPVVVTLPYKPPPVDDSPRPVPDVAGRSIREAVLALHRRGFRVTLHGLGRVSRTSPTGGEMARAGTAVVVETE
jgi:hypothetical protein